MFRSSGFVPEHEAIHQLPIKLTSASVTAVQQAKENGVKDWRCAFLESTSVHTRKVRRKRGFKHFLVKRGVNAKGGPPKARSKGQSAKQKAAGRLQRPARHIECIPANFGRSARGRELIRQEVTALKALDRGAFPTKPLFGEDGVCRLRVPEAEGLTWDVLVKRAPVFLEAEFPSRVRNLFGKQVHEYLEKAKQQLKGARPTRSMFLKLVRELCRTPDPIE